MSGRDIRDSSAQQLASLAYLKRTIDGSNFWQGIVAIDATDLSRTFDNNRTSSRRAKFYLALSASYGVLLDRRSLQLLDFTRAIAMIAQEAETYFSKDPLPVASNNSYSRKDKARRSIFSRASDDYTLLHIPHFAFAPDLSQAFKTLLETLKDIYSRLLSYLVQASHTIHQVGSAVLESFQKFDLRMRKVLQVMYKELEEIANQKVRSELDSLVQLLQVST